MSRSQIVDVVPLELSRRALELTGLMGRGILAI